MTLVPGATSIATSLTVTFTPAPDFAGTAGFDYTVSDVESQIDVTNVANSTEPLPPLVTHLSSVSAWVDIGVSPRSSINLMVQWNELDMRDFGLDGVVPDTLANVLTLGESAGSYDVVMLWGAWTARF